MRDLFARLELAARGLSAGERLAERAAFARQLVHVTPDPLNVVRGLDLLDEILDELRKLGSAEERSLRQAARKIRERVGAAAQDGGARVDLEVSDDRALRAEARAILERLDRDFEPGLHFMPVRRGEKARRFSTWSDVAFRHVCRIVDELSGLGEAPHVGWRPSDELVETFRRMRATMELALEGNSAWAAPMLRCTIAAAHELRISGSSGRHGEPRMRAKLVVGRLTGLLARHRIDDAIALADLNIEFASFARGQVLEAIRTNPGALALLCEAWAHVEHPMTKDVVARAWRYLGDNSKCLILAREARTTVIEATIEIQSSGEVYHEPAYRGATRDAYLGRLARTAAEIDRELALEWCKEAARSSISLATRLAVIERGELQPRQLVTELDAIEAALGTSYRDASASPIEQALKAFPTEWGYPEFPGECWEDVLAERRETISERITRLRSLTAGSDG